MYTWHNSVVDREAAVTELLEAVEDAGPIGEFRRLERVSRALYQAQIGQKIKQRELVDETGLSRETIRRHVEDEKIRRGEMDPTPRYLEEQERRRKRVKAAKRAHPGAPAAES